MCDFLVHGKRKDTGGWAEGRLVVEYTVKRINADYEKVVKELYIEVGVVFEGKTFRVVRHPVEERSVSKYIGIDDKNGYHIFDGDIVRTKFGRLCYVVYHKSTDALCWDLVPIGTRQNLSLNPPTAWDLWDSKNLEVVGNRYDEGGSDETHKA